MADDVLPILRNFFIQRYDDLKRRLTRALGSEDLAGDALHETWLRLQRDEAYGPVRNPQSYLTRMAVNLAIDAKRSQSKLLSSDELDDLLEMQPDPAPGPAQVAEDRSQLQALKEILTHMPARRREILILVRWEGWSQQEVAARMSISVRTVEYELKAAQNYCATRLGQRNKI